MKYKNNWDCSKCGAIQPYFWDYQRDGLWSCGCGFDAKKINLKLKKALIKLEKEMNLTPRKTR